MNAPQDGELLRLWRDVGTVSEGQPLQPGSGEIVVVTSPSKLVRLLTVLSPRAVTALLLIIEEQTTVDSSGELQACVTGGLREWLVARGMGPSAAQSAVSELLTGGWLTQDRALRPIQTARNGEPLKGSARFHQVSMVNFRRLTAGGAAQRGAPPSAPLRGAAAMSRRERVARDPDALSRVSATELSWQEPDALLPAAGDSGPANAQVSRQEPSTLPPDVAAPSTSYEPSQRNISQQRQRPEPGYAGQVEALLALDVPAGVDPAAALTSVLVRQPARAGEVYQFLTGAPPRGLGELGDLLAALLTATGPDVDQLGLSTAEVLRAGGVNVPKLEYRRILAMTVAASLAAIDATTKIENYAAWFGAAFNGKLPFRSTTLEKALQALTAPPSSARPPAAIPDDDPAPADGEEQRRAEHVARVKAAVAGTEWEEPERFAALLANPREQLRVLAQLRSPRPTGPEPN